jgi:hypothetical protein
MVVGWRYGVRIGGVSFLYLGIEEKSLVWLQRCFTIHGGDLLLRWFSIQKVGYQGAAIAKCAILIITLYQMSV